MQKNNVLLVLSVLLLVSCSKTSGPKTLLSELEMRVSPKNLLSRNVAANKGLKTKCLKDTFGVEMLKEEMKVLEEDYLSAQRVSGYWKHIDLSTLPTPQGNFLKAHGDTLGDLKNPNRFDDSNCRDVPCLFNSLYGKENHIAGYVHYIWYLRFGSLLSADNLVPYQISDTPGIFAGKSVPLKDYLYSDQELYALWRVSKMLKAPFTKLTKLTEIQRVPKLFKYEQEEYKTACGLAHSGGWITLTDKCLELDDVENGPLYRSVIHELSHQIDYQDGSKLGKSYRSYESDYLNFSGFSMIEYINEKEEKVREWKLNPDAKLVSFYSQNSPAEHFAESLAYFRTRGDQVYNGLSKDFLEFISREYFDHESFRHRDIFKRMFQKYNIETYKMAFEALKQCSQQSISSSSKYFRAEDFSVSLSPVVVNCIGVRASEYAELLKSTIALNEVEGCSSFNNKRDVFDWEGTVKEHLRDILNQYLITSKHDKDFLSKIEAFYSELDDKTLSRNAFINCFNREDEKKCYQEQIVLLASNKAELFGFSIEHSQQMANIYASLYSFDETKNQSLEIYHVLVGSHLELIRQQTQELWQRCQSQSHDDEATPVAGKFHLSNGYMISSMYNCVNSSIPQTIARIVREFQVGKVKLEHPSEEVLLSREVSSELLKMLSVLYLEGRSSEFLRANEMMLNKQDIHKKVLGDLSWIQNGVDDKKLLEDCKNLVYELVGNDWIFHQKKELFSDLTQSSICSQVPASSEFQKWFEHRKDDYTKEFLNKLDERILLKGYESATECIKEYPGESVVHKLYFQKKREKCLSERWELLEEEALEIVASEPAFIKLKISPEKIKGRIALRRRELQTQVIKEKFK